MFEQQVEPWVQAQMGTASSAPRVVATIYSHRCVRCPDTIAGAIDLAGFIEAPQIGPANMASKPTTAPMAMPAVMPFSLAPVETHSMTYMSMNVSIVSSMKD